MQKSQRTSDIKSIPTVDPRYFLGVNFEEGKTVFAVCTAADCRKVWQQQGGFSELVPGRIGGWQRY